jgi:VIT1/CCC1 family predicted Fe2+/Mn2+ transporter
MGARLLAPLRALATRHDAPAHHPSASGDVIEHHHRNVKGGGARAAIFGISDGLVSNLSIVLGVAGAHPTAGFVRLAGLSGLLGGAFSMAAGEYVSMRAQRELLERELDIERRELQRRPESERRELVLIYQRRGLEPELARELADRMMATPEMALETHAREELGIDPTSLGSPIQAALSSFVAFGAGAVLPLIPFLIGTGTAAVLAAVVVVGVAAIGIGSALSLFTGRSWAFSAGRQLVVCALAGAITYGVGSAIGVGGG